MQNITSEQHEGQFLGRLLSAETEDEMLELLKALSHRQTVDLATVICGDPDFWPDSPGPEPEDAEWAAQRTAKYIIEHRGQDPEEALEDLGHLADLEG